MVPRSYPTDYFCNSCLSSICYSFQNNSRKQVKIVNICYFKCNNSYMVRQNFLKIWLYLDLILLINFAILFYHSSPTDFNIIAENRKNHIICYFLRNNSDMVHKYFLKIWWYLNLILLIIFAIYISICFSFQDNSRKQEK